MHFEKDNIYHIYNMGNQSNKVFFSNENYLFFLRKVRAEIKPYCEILACCLMPNHFHFMIPATEKSVEYSKDKKMQTLGRKIGNLLSSYTQAIIKQEGIRGSLFRQRTKAKSLAQFITYPLKKRNYLLTCFICIHQNPISSGLVEKHAEWIYSSYLDFSGLRNGTLCNISKAFELLNIDRETFKYLMDEPLSSEDTKYIW